MSGGFGDWCAQGSSGRVTSVDFDPATCSWKDCWAKLAQGNVTDLDYDESSGRCVAIQSCNTESYNHTVSSSASDPSTDIVAKTGGNLYIKDCSAASADSAAQISVIARISYATPANALELSWHAIRMVL